MKHLSLIIAALLLGTSPLITSSLALADEQIVAERKSNFRASGGAMRAMRGQVGAGDFAAIEASAQMIAAWAEKMPSYFPEGTGPDNDAIRTSAKASIWDRFDEFTALANNNHKAALALMTAAQNEDASAVMSAMQTVGQSCGACHSQFKN